MSKTLILLLIVIISVSARPFEESSEESEAFDIPESESEHMNLGIINNVDAERWNMGFDDHVIKSNLNGRK